MRVGKKLFFVFGILCVLSICDARAHEIDEALDHLQAMLLRENAVRIAALAEQKTLSFLEYWQNLMRECEGEIVLRDTLKGKLNAWVSGRLSHRLVAPEELEAQYEALARYGEHVARYAAQFERHKKWCAAAQSPEAIEESTGRLCDAVEEILQAHQDNEKQSADRVTHTLALTASLPSHYHQGLPYDPPSMLERYGAQLIYTAFGAASTSAYLAIAGPQARARALNTTAAVAGVTWGQLRDSALAVFYLFKPRNEVAPPSPGYFRAALDIFRNASHPKAHISQLLDATYQGVIKPYFDLTKAATIGTLFGTVIYKNHHANITALTDEILEIVNNISQMLNTYASHDERGVEISESDGGFLLLWTEQLRHNQEVAPENYRNMITDILRALDDEKLSAEQKLRSIDISLRRLRIRSE